MKHRKQGKNSDSDKLKYAMQELKSQNRNLLKENNRLKKELKSSGIRPIYTTEDEYQKEEVKPVKKVFCSKCRSDKVKEILAGKYLITICEECGSRKRHTKKIDS